MSLATSPPARRHPLGRAGIALGLLGLIFALAVIHAGIGSRPIAAHTFLRALFAYDPGDFDQRVLVTLRLARIAGAFLVGTALGTAGMLLQSLLRNPLAEPHILGLNAGAGLAVVLATSLPVALAPAGLGRPLLAAAGAAIVFGLVLMLASAGRAGLTMPKVTFCGIAFSALASSLTSAVLILDEETLAQMQLWLAGDLAGVNYTLIGAALAPAGAALILALALAPRLNVLALGDAAATGLGVPVRQTRAAGLAAAALLCGAAVSVAGPIGFVGLVVPGIARRLAGGDLRIALPFSALLGAALVLAADIAARTLAGSHELATGIMTAAVGAPVFIVIVSRYVR